MKVLVLLFLIGFGYAVLRVLKWLKAENVRWLNGQPSYHDGFSWLGDLLRRFMK